MLHINDLTYRIAGRALYDQATATVASGWKVGFVGRNGTGKSTLLRMIRDELSPDEGSIRLQQGCRLGFVAQEAPATHASLLETVLAADQEHTALLEAAQHAHDANHIAEIQTRLADIEAHSAESRAATILSGLGFSHAQQEKPCADFSGGWRMRVALAGVLFSKPDILLLDEPTNYLDLEGTVWLETYLRKYPYTALIVSHDRALLNNAVTHILALENGKLTLSPGGYDLYALRRYEARARLLADHNKQEETRRQMTRFIERFRAKATKARQAQSRIKMLEKMQTVSMPLAERTIPFTFPSPNAMAPPIVRLVNADLGYTSDQPVLKNITLRIDQDDRVAILGANGQGKSTLVKAIAGRLSPLSGHVYKSKKLTIAYFAQHQIDELHPEQTAYEHIYALMPDATQANIRAKTAQIGFGADKADVKVCHLSGGEKARLLLGLITLHGPHMLILDEPTNHLDIDSRDALIYALNSYSGAVLLITHDTHLVKACAERLWLVDQGLVTRFDDDLDTYRQLILDKAKQKRKTTRSHSAHANKTHARKTAAQNRAMLAPLKKKVAVLEKEIDDLVALRDKVDAALATPDLFAKDIDRATHLSKQRATILARITKTEEAWITAAQAYDTAHAEQEN